MSTKPNFLDFFKSTFQAVLGSDQEALRRTAETLDAKLQWLKEKKPSTMSAGEFAQFSMYTMNTVVLFQNAGEFKRAVDIAGRFQDFAIVFLKANPLIKPIGSHGAICHVGAWCAAIASQQEAEGESRAAYLSRAQQFIGDAMDYFAAILPSNARFAALVGTKAFIHYCNGELEVAQGLLVSAVEFHKNQMAKELSSTWPKPADTLAPEGWDELVASLDPNVKPANKRKM